MAGFQRIAVVSSAAAVQALDSRHLDVAPRPLVLAAPTGAARELGEAVVGAVGGECRAEPLLNPVRFPSPDRGHLLDALVREHARRDPFRDVVVIADPASNTLLLRVLAPDQLAGAGPIVLVGLRRLVEPVSLPRAALLGGVVGLASAALDAVLPLFALTLVAVVVGLVLQVAPRRRRTGREVLVASLVSAVVLVMVVASSTRFPAT